MGQAKDEDGDENNTNTQRFKNFGPYLLIKTLLAS
jgi:hypothetical protein